MKIILSALLLYCLLLSSCVNSDCPYEPGTPQTPCDVLQGQVIYDDMVDIIFIDTRRDSPPAGSSRKPVEMSYLEYIMTWDTLIDGNLKKLYVDTVATCPCDAELFMLKGNPDLDPQDRRTAAQDKDPGATQFLESNFTFPIPAPPIVLDEVRKDTAKGKRGGRADFAEVEIAIIDTGVDDKSISLQPVLSSHIPQVTNCPDFNSAGFDFASISYPPIDESGHGTHVAGIVAEGGGPRMKLSNFKFTRRGNNEERGSLFAALCALNFAIENRVDIINCSWGYYAPEANPLLKEMVNRAEKAGIMIVAAAGNHTQNLDVCPFWPASFGLLQPNVLTVASANAGAGAPSGFTNYGKAVQLFAHGEDIYSPVPGNICGGRSGTSMAAPVITRLLATYIQNGTSFADLKTKLQSDPMLKDFVCPNSFTSAWNKYLDYIPTPCP